MGKLTTLVVTILWALSGCSVILPLDTPGEQQDSVGVVEMGAVDGVGEGTTIDTNGDPGPDALDGSGSEGPTKADLKIPDAAQPCLDTKCPINTWCQWATGLPSTTPLHDLHGTSLDNLWAVGANGTLLRFDPKSCSWVSKSAPVASTIRGVWTDGTTLHIVGDGGQAWWRAGGSWSNNKGNRCDGVSLADMQPIDLKAITGSGSRLYAVGTQGTVLEFKNTCWDAHPSGVSVGKVLYGVSGGTMLLHAGGSSGTLVEANATMTSLEFNPACAVSSDVQIHAVWSTGHLSSNPDYALVAVGEDLTAKKPWFLYDASGTCPKPSNGLGYTRWNDVHGFDKNNVWMVGDGKKVYWPGGGMQTLPATASADLNTVWVHKDSSSNDRWVVVGTQNGEVWARRY